MKRLVIAMAAMLLAGSGFAQTDTTQKATDTVRVGNFVIIKKNKPGSESNTNFEIKFGSNRKKRNSNISTNWFIFDLGFANWRDQTNYTAAQSGSYFRQFRPQDGPVDKNSFSLRAGKTSNVNIWLFMQKLNISKHKLNLKYGLGLEMYNFRFEHNISFRNNPAPYVYNDSIDFSKNKLYVGYATVPLMINFTPNPDKRRAFNISAGVSAGYRISSRNKQISDERGKVKYRGDLGLEQWRVAAVGEIGLGPVRIYGSYGLTRLSKETTGLEQYPYAIGIRFSNW